MINAEGVIHGGGDGVRLHAGAENAGGGEGHEREDPGKELVFGAVLNVKRRAPGEFAVDLFFVNLPQSGFHEGARSPEECDDPHPEKGARTAETDGGGHPRDVSGADAARERHAERLKGRNPGFVLALLEHEPNHFRDHSQLYEAAAERKIGAGGKKESHQNGTPNNVVNEGGEFHG